VENHWVKIYEKIRKTTMVGFPRKICAFCNWLTFHIYVSLPGGYTPFWKQISQSTKISRNGVDFAKPPNLEVEYWIYHKTWGVFFTKYEDSSPTHMENLSTIGIEPFQDAGEIQLET
jgi:hypothetical protein